MSEMRQRTGYLIARVRPAEKIAVDAAAKLCGISPAELIRRAVFAQLAPKAVDSTQD